MRAYEMSILDNPNSIVERANDRIMLGLPAICCDQRGVILDASQGNVKLIGRLVLWKPNHFDWNVFDKKFRARLDGAIKPLEKTGWFLPSKHDWEKQFGKTCIEAYTNFRPIAQRGYLPDPSTYGLLPAYPRFITSNIYHSNAKNMDLPMVYYVNRNTPPIYAAGPACEVIYPHHEGNVYNVMVLLWKRCEEYENEHLYIEKL